MVCRNGSGIFYACSFSPRDLDASPRHTRKKSARRFLLVSALGEIRRNFVSPWRNEPREKHIVDAARTLLVPAGPLSYPSCRITRHTLTSETNRLRTCCTCPYEKERDQWILIPAQIPTAIFGLREIGSQLMYISRTVPNPLRDLLLLLNIVFDMHFTTYSLKRFNVSWRGI